MVAHCYTTPEDVEHSANLAALANFCRGKRREANQGEIGLVMHDEYFAIREFEEV